MLTRPDGSFCKSLLSDGNAGPTGEWRPYGCMTHMYTAGDSLACLEQLAYWRDVTRLYFIGDSRLATLFEAFARHLNSSWPSVPHNFEPLLPVLWRAKRFTMCFLRHDEITSDTIALLNNWRSVISHNAADSPSPLPSNLPNAVRDSECFLQPPSHLVLSFGAFTILRYNGSDLGLLDYQRNLEALVPILSDMSFVRTVWMLLDPVAEGLLADRLKILTNKEINKYNNVAQKVMNDVQRIEVWRSNRLIAQRMGFPAVNWHCPQVVSVSSPSGHESVQGANYSAGSTDSAICEQPPSLSDGFHVSAEAMYQDAQILLNLYCNNQMHFEDGTCCRSPEPITAVQKRCFIFILLCLIATAICFLYDTFLRSRICCLRFSVPVSFKLRCCSTFGKNADPLKPTDSTCTEPPLTMFQEFYDLLCALSKLGLILIYFFVCDRTLLFMKTNKGFTIMSFLLPLVYLFVLGLFFSGPTKETHINHVDITREWKGWMQIYFLIYHFTGSYRVIPVYLFTRYFTSTYLFLSGFGHFHYYWHHPLPASLLCKLIPFRLSLRELRATASSWWSMLHRYLLVMYRMNFFVLGLCLVMNRDYLFYFFVPLVSFWFSVITVLMLSFPRVSSEHASVEETRPTPHGHTFPSQTVPSPRCLPPPVPTFDLEANNDTVSSFSTQSIQDLDLKSSFDSSQNSNQHGSSDCNFICNLRSTQSSSTLDWRGHQKALSLGTGFDVRQWNVSTSGSVPLRATKKSKVTQSGPPWTEDLIRKAWSVVPSSPSRWSECRRSSVLTSVGNSVGDKSRRYCCFRLRLADVIIVLKLITLIIGVELLYRSPFHFRSIFFHGPQRHLFQLKTTAPNPMEPFGDGTLVGENAWFYRWSIDRYSVIYGMVFALLCEWARRFGCLNDSHSGDLGLPAPYSQDSTRIPLTDQKTAGSVNRSALFAASPRQSLSARDTPPMHPDDTSRSASFTLDQPSLIVPALKHISSSSNDQSLLNVTYAPNVATSQFNPCDYGNSWFSKITCRRFAAIVLTVFGVMGIVLCMLIIAQCKDPDSISALHPFLCVLPILSFIVVRNCLGVLRKNYSFLFAWVGDVSLELYVAQHHIWLSADGNGILVLLPGYPLLNLAVTSFLFICVCCELRNLSRKLQRFIVPDGVFQLVRNALLIGLIVHLITNVHEGV